MATPPQDMGLYAAELRQYVKQYQAAAARLPEEPQILLPRTQIRGQLLELALKAYMATRGEYREGHDLVALAKQAIDCGLELTDNERDSIIPKISELYHYHAGRDHYYLTRYPDPVPKIGVWVTPNRDPYDELIASIVEQTKRVRKK